MGAADRAASAIDRWTADSRPWLIAGLLLRAAFAVRLGGRFYQADEWGFTGAAQALAERGFRAGTGEGLVFAPGAPLFFALFFKLGLGFFAARLAQGAVSVLTAWMLGRATAELTGSERAGRLALALACVYPFFVYYAGMLMSETLYLALTVAGLWLLCRSVREAGASRRPAAAAGLLLAAAGLTRTECVGIGAAIFCVLGALAFRGRYAARSLALAVLAWALPLAGWAARSKALVGAWVLDVHGGITILIGTKYFELDQVDTAVAAKALRESPEHAAAAGLGVVEADRLYLREALRFMASHPGATARQWAAKFLNFWRLYPRQDKAYPSSEAVRPTVGARPRLLALASLTFEPALIGLGLYGAWLLRFEAARIFPLHLMVVLTCAVHVLVVSQMRYRLPVMPWLLLFSCLAADRLLQGRGRGAA